MANRTVKDAQTIKGTNPQYLIEKIIRTRIYDCKYWKEECFALTAELLVDKAMELRYIGGVYGGNIKPSPFLCLTLKMLQLQPEKDIVVEFIKNEDFKYVRSLGAFYLRLTGSSIDCYKYLEPLLNDYRKIRMQKRDGTFELSHMDEYIDALLREERACDIILPRIMSRQVLEENNDIDPRVSVLEDDLNDLNESDSSSEEEGEDRTEQAKNKAHEVSSSSKKRKRRSRSRDRNRDRKKRSRSRSRSPRSRRDRSRDRNRSRRDRDRDHRDRRDDRGSRGGGSKDDLSVEETNKLRASLGLPPLK